MSRAPINPHLQNALKDLLKKPLTDATKEQIKVLLSGGAFFTADVMSASISAYFIDSKNSTLNQNFNFCFQHNGFQSFVMALVNTAKKEHSEKFIILFKLVAEHLHSANVALATTAATSPQTAARKIARENPALSNLLSTAIYFDLFKLLHDDIKTFLTAGVSPFILSTGCKDPSRLRKNSIADYSKYTWILEHGYFRQENEHEKRYKNEYFAIPAIWEAIYRDPSAVRTLTREYGKFVPLSAMRDFESALNRKLTPQMISHSHSAEDLQANGKIFYNYIHHGRHSVTITPYLIPQATAISLADYATTLGQSDASTSLALEIASVTTSIRYLEKSTEEILSEKMNAVKALSAEAMQDLQNGELFGAQLRTNALLQLHKERCHLLADQTQDRDSVFSEEANAFQDIVDKNRIQSEERAQIFTLAAAAKQTLLNAAFSDLTHAVNDEHTRGEYLTQAATSKKELINEYLSNGEASLNTFQITLPDAKTPGDCRKFRDQLTEMLTPLEVLYVKIKKECDEKELSVKKQNVSPEKTPDAEKYAVLKAGLDFLTHRIKIIKQLRDCYHYHAAEICAGTKKSPSQELLYSLLLAIQFLHSLDNNPQYAFKRFNLGNKFSSDTTQRVNELLAHLPAAFKNKLIGANNIHITEDMMKLYSFQRSNDAAIPKEAPPTPMVPFDNRDMSAIRVTLATLPPLGQSTCPVVMELSTWCELYGLFLPKDKCVEAQTTMPNVTTSIVTEQSFFTRFLGKITGNNPTEAAAAARSA